MSANAGNQPRKGGQAMNSRQYVHWGLVETIMALAMVGIVQATHAGAIATGGTITASGDYIIHTFRSNGTFEVVGG